MVKTRRSPCLLPFHTYGICISYIATALLSPTLLRGLVVKANAQTSQLPVPAKNSNPICQTALPALQPLASLTSPLLQNSSSRSWYDLDSKGPRLPYDTLTHALPRYPRQSQFRLFYLRDLVHVLQADRADLLVAGVARALPLAFDFGHLRGIEEQPRGLRCADVEVE